MNTIRIHIPPHSRTHAVLAEFVVALDDAETKRQHIEQLFEPYKVTMRDFLAMEFIDRNEKKGEVVRQIDLRDALELNQGTITQAVDRLEELMLVERRRIPVDRRSNKLVLTDIGALTLKQLRTALEVTA